MKYMKCEWVYHFNFFNAKDLEILHKTITFALKKLWKFGKTSKDTRVNTK